MTTGTNRQLQSVPNLVGLTQEDAELVLLTAGFPAPDVKYCESYEPIHSVVSQQPLPNSIRDSNTVIQVMVSQRNLVRFLPGIFQREDPTGGNFLRDFLWIFQHIIDGINQKIDGVHEIFDPHETPAEFLPWLASWSAFTIDENWPEEQRRELIKKAMEFYRIRGTKKGLINWLELFTGTTPTILENEWPFKGFQIGVASTIGVDSIILPPVNTAHCFIVEFPIHADDITDEMIIRIHDIIQAQKPAHTTYFLRFQGTRKNDTSWVPIIIGDHRVGAGMEIIDDDDEDSEDEDMDLGI